MDPLCLMMDLTGVPPFEIVFTYVWTKILPLRSNVAFWCTRLGIEIPFLLFRSLLPPVLVGILGAVVSALLPYLFSTGPRSRRILVVLLANVILFAAELLGGALWMALTGEATVSNEASRRHLAAFYFVHVAHILIASAAFYGMWRWTRRLHAVDAGSGASGVGKAKAEADGGMWLYVLFPLAQLGLLSVILPMQQWMRFEGQDALVFGGVVVVLLCGAVDVLLVRQLSRYRKRRLADQRAALLEGQLAAYLERYGETVREVETVARVRHDLKNQLLAADETAHRGDVRRARAQLEGAARLLEATGDAR